MSKYGAISGPYFSAFGLNTGIYGVNPGKYGRNAENEYRSEYSPNTAKYEKITNTGVSENIYGSNTEKYGPEITPYLDFFYEVLLKKKKVFLV